MDRLRRLQVLVVLAVTLSLPGCTVSPSPVNPTPTEAASPVVVTGVVQSSGSALREITGEIELFGGCVGVRLPDIGPTVVVWPLGFGLSPDGKDVGNVNGWVAIGDELTSSRGWVFDPADIDVQDEGVVLQHYDSCDPALPVVSLTSVEGFDIAE